MSAQHEYDRSGRREGKSSFSVFQALLTVIVVVAVILVGYYLYRSWSSQREADTVRKSRDGRSQVAHEGKEEYVAAGKKLFESLCVGCHGKDAKGGVGPDLTVSTFRYGKSRATITKTITEGRPGGMPTFSSQLDKEQIQSLVEFVLTLK